MKLSYHFGLNGVNPAAYGGWDGELSACCNDATDLAALAGRAGYTAKAFFDAEATRDQLRDVLRREANRLANGDALLLSYSGHGGQLPCVTEADGENETLCFYDGELVDDELHDLLSKFAFGVRIAILLDSCHSGGMDRALHRSPQLHRCMPAHVARSLRRPERRAGPRGNIKASVLFLCACREGETALDGTDNGAFTESLLAELPGGLKRAFGFTWGDWFRAASDYCAEEHPEQHPVARRVGVDGMWKTPALT